MDVDYLSVQIAVAIAMCIAGVFAYTLFRYHWKDATIKNLNDFLKNLDIDLVIEKLKFDSKFWKTAAVSMVISVVIVALIYAELIVQIVPGEHILVTAFKFFAVGLGMNFTINSLSSGGKLSSIIQAILTALLANDIKSQGIRSNGSANKTAIVKAILESNNVIVHERNKEVTDEAVQIESPQDKPKE